MFSRSLNIADITSKKSVFLLGPRQTGKSTLLRLMLPDALYIDLLSPPLFRELAAHPENLEDMARHGTDLIIIDEIQSLPDLLGVVHRLIEREKKRFVLTGSSARKLRKGGTNLLGGRARMCHLLPITTHELSQSNATENWLTLLECGGIPSILTSSSPQEDLDAYVGLYLREKNFGLRLRNSKTTCRWNRDIASSAVLRRSVGTKNNHMKSVRTKCAANYSCP
jgi:predicted AAA+ superfamily ATPase